MVNHMTKKNKSVFVCQSCGYQTLKWLGRCPDCGQWNCMVEEAQKPVQKNSRSSSMSKPETINAIIAERKKQYPELHKLGTDLAVPDDRLRDMWQVYKDSLSAADLQWVAFGHIGNNHVHINILPRNGSELQEGLKLYGHFAAKAVEFKGTVSAEHGIGKMKTNFLELMYSPDHLDEMRAVKLALDPENLLNPGNIFPS